MSRAWLSIVGIGDGGLDDLTAGTRTLIDEAEVLVGGARHLGFVVPDKRPRIQWSLPLERTVARIKRLKPRKVCVLATGDPMAYGIGVTLARHIGMDEMTIVPQPSAFSLACARLGWPLAEVEALTLHGRPLDKINAYVQPGARLLLLSHDRSTPAKVAAALRAMNYGASRMHVLEHMGGGKERIVSAAARHWQRQRSADLNTIAIECVAGKGAARLSRVPGLPDDTYDHDGQLTKTEVRAATLAALAPLPGELLWDVGAGAGSIAIEWLRADRRNRAVAIERDSKRARRLRANAAKLGVPDLTLVEGAAPAALKDLEKPQAIFIGGGLADRHILAACWRALAADGRMVANAVTASGEACLLDCHRKYGGSLTRLAITRLEKAGKVDVWRALAPVTQYRAVKT